MSLASLLARAQIVNIPDTNLKFILITYPVADLGNGFNEIADTNGDGEIQVAEAEAVLGLQLVEQSIADLEGLQYFINIEVIDCSQNYLIDYIPTTYWPNLKYLESDDNNIVNIDVTQNSFLEILILEANPLISIDVTQNSVLKELYLNSCQLSSIDITQNILLEKLYCTTNQLISLNIKNNNNTIITRMFAQNNPNLTCIQVDDVEYANNQSNWHKDQTAIYSEDCNLGIDDVLATQITLYPNPVKNRLQISTQNDVIISKIEVYDVLGKRVLESEATTQLDISSLASGLLFVKFETDKGFAVKKIVKE